jgi:hypothetical protein
VLSVDMLAKSVAVEIDSADVEPVAGRVQAGQYADGFYHVYSPGEAIPSAAQS